MQERIISEQFIFRNIKPEETGQAIAMEQICFPPHEACSAEAMTERIIAAPELFLVAEDKEVGRIAGFFNGVATDEAAFRDEFFKDIVLHKADGKNVMLLGLDVLPEYRGQGCGSELLGLAEEYFKQKRITAVALTTDTAPGFYIKHGYRHDPGFAAKNGDPVYIKHLY